MTSSGPSSAGPAGYASPGGSVSSPSVVGNGLASEVQTLERAIFEVKRIIVGQDQLVERILVGLLAKGHVLLEGVPGVAKTLAVETFARVVGGTFARIQFTPDLVPTDIIGTRIYRQGREEFDIEFGPVMCNFLLADEINRAPAKVQSALLEAMQERQVTLGDETHPLPRPFLVLATQNPLEQEGTYPLPEAQLDRFMFLIELDYPNEAEEVAIARTTTGEDPPSLDHVLTGPEISQYQQLVRRVPVPDHIYQFAARLVRKTRPRGETAPPWLKPLVAWGAGPRAVQYLVLGAKSRAALSGSYMARLEDIEAVAAPVLTHRLITTFAAQAEGIDAKAIVARLVKETIDEEAG